MSLGEVESLAWDQNAALVSAHGTCFDPTAWALDSLNTSLQVDFDPHSLHSPTSPAIPLVIPCTPFALQGSLAFLLQRGWSDLAPGLQIPQAIPSHLFSDPNRCLWVWICTFGIFVPVLLCTIITCDLCDFKRLFALADGLAWMPDLSQRTCALQCEG